MVLDDWKGILKEGLASVRRKNAIQPCAWFCALISVPCFYWSTVTADKTLRIVLVVIGLIPIALFCFAYIYFMITDPDRLHSEEFQLKSRSLAAVESKGGALVINPIDLTVNPLTSRKELTGGHEDTDE